MNEGEGIRALTTLVNATSNLDFTYTRNKAAFDSGYLFDVQYSDILAAPWISAGPGTITVDGPQQTLTAIIPAGPAGSRFVRLKITSP